MRRKTHRVCSRLPLSVWSARIEALQHRIAGSLEELLQGSETQHAPRLGSPDKPHGAETRPGSHWVLEELASGATQSASSPAAAGCLSASMAGRHMMFTSFHHLGLRASRMRGASCKGHAE